MRTLQMLHGWIVRVTGLFAYVCVFFSSRRRHTRCALVTGVQTCALPILFGGITRGVADLPARVTSCVPNRPRRVARRMADVLGGVARGVTDLASRLDRKSTRLNSSH